MEIIKTQINNIPAVLYGEKSEKLYLFIHGKNSYKEEAYEFAKIIEPYNYQVLSFDLPEHGELKNEKRQFTVQNCVSDLHTVMDSIIESYDSFSLYANSIGAYFSLLAFKNIHFDKCLFVSPVLDMERLIQNMMSWADVTNEELKTKKEIETSFGETLSWDYYQFVKNNPVDFWESETFILYGENDNLTEKSVLDSFQKRFNCFVRILENGEHYFHTQEQLLFLTNWVEEVIQ